MTTIRCSSTDMGLECASAWAPTDAPYNPNTPEAREGTAGHEALACVVRGESPDIDAIARHHGVDADALTRVVDQGRKIWAQVSRWFGAPLAEQRMSEFLADGVELRGSADIVSFGANRVIVLDWKLGWSPSEHPKQVKSYAYLGLCCGPDVDEVTGIEAWVRSGEVRVWKFSREELRRHKDEILGQVKNIGKQYGPGQACKWCPHQNHCKAREEYLHGACTALAPFAGDVPATRELVAKLWDRSRELGAALRHFDAVVDACLDDGPIDLGDGRELRVVESAQDSIRASKAMHVFRGDLEISADEIDEVLSVAKSGLERVMKARAPARQGATYMRDAMQKLRDAGAVEKQIKRTKKAVPKELRR